MSDGTIPGKPVRIYQEDGGFNDYSTEEVVAAKLNSFLGWKCAAGVENLCINFDGDVQSASCGSIGPDGRSGKYGNVFEEFKLDGKWITCAQEFCSCGADLFIPKVRKEKFKSHLKFTNGDQHELDKRTPALTRAVGVERTFNSRNKQIFWEIGRRCNFDCSYCHTYVHNNYEEHKSLEKLIFATNKLEQFSKGEKINFAISGGEPTLNPDYLEWAKYLFSKGHKLSTHSNGSRSPEYYQELITLSDLNISVHFEFFQKEKMLELLTILAKTIKTRRDEGKDASHVEVMLMMSPGISDKVLAFEKELWEIPHFREYCTLTIMPIRGHESIENKEQRTGDTLVSYPEDEASRFGNRTLGRLMSEDNVSSRPRLKAFDHLDLIKDPVERQKAFDEMMKTTT